MSDEVADALAATREYIEKFGLWKGTLFGPDSKACVMGALTITQKGWNVQNPTNILCNVVGASAVVSISRTMRAEGIKWSIPDWNDAESTTEQEVLDLLAKAEKIERNGGVNPDE